GAAARVGGAAGERGAAQGRVGRAGSKGQRGIAGSGGVGPGGVGAIGPRISFERRGYQVGVPRHLGSGQGHAFGAAELAGHAKSGLPVAAVGGAQQRKQGLVLVDG
nr:hypothetical protein [Tanacetum cinerariifolium]